MGDGGGDIIIKGGSVELNFNDSVYQRVLNDPSTYRNQNRQISRVLVEDQEGKVQFDSGEQSGLTWRITVSTR
jgi:hypothetical protein